MERNVTLDFVRGVAILGILLLNISAFGLPKAAYLNPAWSGSASLSDAWTWALLDLLAQVKFLTLFALLFGAGLQLLLPRGKRWIQSRLTLLALLGFIHGLFFWDGDILLAYALVGLVSWRMVREAHHVKSLFNTGVVLYLTGIAVLVLLGMISGTAANRSWAPDAANHSAPMAVRVSKYVACRSSAWGRTASTRSTNSASEMAASSRTRRSRTESRWGLVNRPVCRPAP